MRTRSTLLTIALALGAPAGAYAQSTWLGAGPARHTMALEAIRPTFDGEGMSATSGVLVLSGRFRTSASTRVVLEVPFAHAAFDDDEGSSNSVGNPYLGMEWGDLDGGHYVELGIRPPLLGEGDGDDYAAGVGALGDMDRLEAFAEEALTVSSFFNLRTAPRPRGLQAHARLGAIAMKPDGDLETWLGYGGHLIQDLGGGRVGAGVTGRWILSEDTDGFADATVHQLGLFGDVRLGRMRPGLHVRVPLDEDIRQIVDYVVGLQVQVDVR